MILWTIQDEAVWQKLQETGVYTTPSSLIEFPPDEDPMINHMHYAYKWMAEQMRKRIGPPPEGVEFPVWGWYKQYKRPDGMPDMRQPGHYLPGKPCVRLKLDVPDWEVLLSDFDDWHFALNYSYLDRNREDSDAFDTWYESLGVTYNEIRDWNNQSEALRVVRERLEKSWERMIGVHPQDESWGFPWAKRSIQATFWELRRDEVLSVEHFIGR